MADYKSSLPVRTEVDPDEKLQTRLVDGSDPLLMAQIDSDKNLHVEIHGNKVGGTTDIVQTFNEEGYDIIDGVYNLTTNSKPSSAGVIASSRGASTDETTQTKRVTAVTDPSSPYATCLDVALHDEDGKAFSTTNPIPVFITGSAGGDEVLDENTAVAVPTSGTREQSTVTALGAAALAVASGPCKYFTFQDGTTNFYVWFEVSALGTDPAPGGTGIKVTLPLGTESANVVATTTRAAISASVAQVNVGGSAAAIVIQTIASVNSTDTAAATSGMSITVNIQGNAEVVYHTYDVTTGKTLTLQKIHCSASGRAKFEVRIGTTGSETKKVTGFVSSSNNNWEYEFFNPQTLTDAMSVVIVKTNRDLQPQDLYSTIEGVEQTVV